MSNKPQDDINLEELSSEELISIIVSERKKAKRRVRRIKEELNDTGIALIMAIGARDKAYRDLDAADLVIIDIVESTIQKSGQGVS